MSKGFLCIEEITTNIRINLFLVTFSFSLKGLTHILCKHAYYANPWASPFYISPPKKVPKSTIVVPHCSFEVLY